MYFASYDVQAVSLNKCQIKSQVNQRKMERIILSINIKRKVRSIHIRSKTEIKYVG